MWWEPLPQKQKAARISEARVFSALYDIAVLYRHISPLEVFDIRRGWQR